MATKEGIEVPLILTLDAASERMARQSFLRSARRTVQTTMSYMDRSGGNSGVLGQVMFPSRKGMKQNVRRQGQQAQQGLRGMQQTVQALGKEARTAEQQFNSLFNSVEKARKADEKHAASRRRHQSGGGGGRGPGVGKVGIGGRMARGAKTAGGWTSRNAIKAGVFGAGSILGFLVSAFREAIGSYEKQTRARMEGSAVLGPKAKYAHGADYAYNSAEAAQIQANAARQGITGGRRGGRNALKLMRGLGQESLAFGGGIMSRQNLRGGAGSDAMMRTISESLALGVETGLERARIGEFLAAANQLSEQQIRITPGKDGYKGFAEELARLQLGGMRGRFAGGALAQAHSAIQGATGVQQAFAMRAFGFGKGAGLIDVLKRQEQGAGGGNMMAIMEQLRSEYGSNKQGGLSDAGKLAFKGMGMGSIHMAEEFSKVYLQQKQGKLSPEEARQKIQDIKEKEKAESRPRAEREAWAAMKKFGGFPAILAKRFDRMANLGSNQLDTLFSIDSIQQSMLHMVGPMFEDIKTLVPLIRDGMRAIAGPVRTGIQAISGSVTKLLQGIGAFAKAYSGSSNMFSGMSNGWGAFLNVYNEKSGTEVDISRGLSRGGAMDMLQRFGLEKSKKMVTEAYSQLPYTTQNTHKIVAKYGTIGSMPIDKGSATGLEKMLRLLTSIYRTLKKNKQVDVKVYGKGVGVVRKGGAEK